MVMRLVRDDDYGPMELEEELQPPRPGASAIDDDDTVVHSFELGAADYIRKPVNMAELTARINSVLRRTRTASPCWT